MEEQLVCIPEERRVCRVLVEKPQGKRTLGRPRHGWEEHIKIGLKELGWEGMDWSCVAQDTNLWQALVNNVMSLGIK